MPSPLQRSKATILFAWIMTKTSNTMHVDVWQNQYNIVTKKKTSNTTPDFSPSQVSSFNSLFSAQQLN